MIKLTTVLQELDGMICLKLYDIQCTEIERIMRFKIFSLTLFILLITLIDTFNLYPSVLRHRIKGSIQCIDKLLWQTLFFLFACCNNIFTLHKPSVC